MGGKRQHRRRVLESCVTGARDLAYRSGNSVALKSFYRDWRIMWELQKQIRIYIAAKRPDDRAHWADSLVLDGFDVTAFASADDLWNRFQARPARIVMTERRFEFGLSGLDLVNHVRSRQPWPYVYVVVMSSMNRMEEIEQGLEAGVDDYLLKPFNPVQLRARALVGLRWLSYLDSLQEGEAATGQGS
ncbi:MAG: response regulator [Verrucomicrobia bacterium]|nr:MAG: response regulator [Verrucomicrobiota bacterium]